jgi:hypothetical protein
MIYTDNFFSLYYIMAFSKSLKNMCSPALFYFYISILSYLIILFQNLDSLHTYNVGSFSCNFPNTILLFIVKLIYILFWTYILNLICKDGYTTISWLIVLFPFILFFVLIGLVMINF